MQKTEYYVELFEQLANFQEFQTAFLHLLSLLTYKHIFRRLIYDLPRPKNGPGDRIFLIEIACFSFVNTALNADGTADISGTAIPSFVDSLWLSIIVQNCICGQFNMAPFRYST